MIKLTNAQSGKTFYLNPDWILEVSESNKENVGAVLNVYNTSLPYHVKETPQQIVRLIEDSEDD
jgi:hypothetical protein